MSCKINNDNVEVKTKNPNFIIKLIQKVNPKPIKNAMVRYDANAKLWALLALDSKSGNYNILQHFSMGVMVNVNFSTIPMNDAKGLSCGPVHDTVGIAQGDLYLHKSNNDIIGAHNLAFTGKGFADENYQELKSAAKVVLMSDRRAVYFKAE